MIKNYILLLYSVTYFIATSLIFNHIIQLFKEKENQLNSSQSFLALQARTIQSVSKNDLQKTPQSHQLHPSPTSHNRSFCLLSIPLYKILHHSSNILLNLIFYHMRTDLHIYLHFSMYKFLHHVFDPQ